MSDYHVGQFDGAVCQLRNCAAASGAMAVAFAGGDRMTARQFRAESGVSCVPGVDTASGGLRIVDVERVAKAHGVSVNYGGLQSWPTTALAARLRLGQGAIVLGDAADAPVQPTAGVVYHSAWVHGISSDDKTHWHDPRLTTGHWVPLSGVIRYWEGMDHGYRYAGFVAPNQITTPPPTDTEPAPAPEAGMILSKVDPTSGYCTTIAACQAVNIATGLRQSIGPNETYQVVCTAELREPGIRWFVCASSQSVEHAYLLAFAPADVTFWTAPAQPAPPTVNCDALFNEALRLAETTVASIPRR